MTFNSPSALAAAMSASMPPSSAADFALSADMAGLAGAAGALVAGAAVEAVAEAHALRIIVSNSNVLTTVKRALLRMIFFSSK
jgi:hypothetical protein